MIKKTAMAGTLESNDVLVEVFPSKGKREVEIESIVMEQFGQEITDVVNATLDQLNANDLIIKLNDKGALNYTIKARVETAVKRGSEQ
ncbi:citrate lyase acyl carrier protein [Mycoplasma sp. P36-A1]|uniref:citrate lyase acyl carrier protein n=1 Tax=Mycoplasma sp. P36-A1 TaxID=3252900 RepID=UPI003C2C25E0